MKQYYVEYRVPSYSPDLILAGPYKTLEEAQMHCDDIGSFEGVVDAFVIQKRDD